MSPSLCEALPSDVEPSYYSKRFKSTADRFQAPPENVILIILDALRPDHLSLYGYPKPTSPFLENIARSSVVFRKAYCQWNLTMASMPSLFTSIYPRISGLVDPDDLSGGESTFYSISSNRRFPYLSEILKKDGFHVAMITQNDWVPKEHQGSFNYFKTVPLDVTLSGRNPRLMLREIYHWLEQGHHQGSFFLTLHFADPHYPYAPPDSLIAKMLPGWDGVDRSLSWKSYLADRYITMYRGNEMARQQVVASYDAEILNLDYHLKELWSSLDTLKILENTLVIISSDHGELLGEKNHVFLHGSTPYEASLRVPLIMYYREFPQNLFVDHRVELVDIVPTILSCMGIEFNGVVNGDNLIPLILGETGIPSDDRAFSSGHFATCLLKGNYKLIFDEMAFEKHHYYDLARLLHPGKQLELLQDIWGETQRLSILDRWALYNIVDDPQEEINLIADEKNLFLSMRRELSHYYRQLDKVDRSMFETKRLNQEEIRRLKALGYID